jgi:hypothetical protein
MNLVISKEHFINPIVRAFGLMEGKNDDESKIIGDGRFALQLLTDAVLSELPRVIQEETKLIEDDRKMLFDILKDVQRQMTAAGDKALDVLSPEVMGDINHIINKIESDNHEQQR